ncbi:hypothetical protein DVH24_037046 [Malus domestica]|uniref:BTB domain-containing protein n=1 Tax=Malus domestica TaxID=3750 RepID=A0A498HH98_MALDO|nr:hypothetical protein DVH24_037046 [Malus domestica]
MKLWNLGARKSGLLKLEKKSTRSGRNQPLLEIDCKNGKSQVFILEIHVSNVEFKRAKLSGSRALYLFDKMSNSGYILDIKLGYHMSIRDKGGTNFLFSFESIDLLASCKDSGFCVVIDCSMGYYCKGIRDKGGTISQRLFNSKSKNQDCVLGSDCSKVVKCEVSFDSSMIIDWEYAGNLELHHLEACMDKNRKNERKFTLSRFGIGCCVVCCVVLDRDYCKGIRDKGGGSKFRYMVTLNIHFSCINASGDSIECSQDGIFGVILLVAYSTCIVVGGEFYSSNIELGRAGKKKSPNVREDYLVHRFYRQKKLTFESNVHGSFGLQDTSHVLEGGKDINNTTFMSGLLTGGRIMTMRDAVILYHLSKNDAEQRKLDVAFIGAKYMLKLENGCSVSVANDLIIQVGDSNFYLHKFPMVMRRGYLNRLVFQRINVGRDASPRIHLDNLPRGAKVFESVVKFCYGWKFDLINIAPLYCATHFLEMSDDFKQGNLISKTETFLSFLIFPSWKDTFRILRSCESISLCAKELKISKRSMEAIAWNARTNLNACSSETDEIQCFNVLPNNAENSRLQGASDIWWFEDVSFLRINHFIEVIQALNWKGSCIAHWTAKWLSRVTSRLERMSLKHMTHQFLGVTTECLVKDVVDGAICSKL